MFEKLDRFMYGNIGKSMKKLAKIFAWIGIVASFLLGLIFIIWGIMELPGLVFASPLVVALGCLLSWISSLALYGFGELIDKTCSIERTLRSEDKKSETQSQLDYERIRKLERLRSQGLITEEEYQQAILKE